MLTASNTNKIQTNKLQKKINYRNIAQTYIN